MLYTSNTSPHKSKRWFNCQLCLWCVGGHILKDFFWFSSVHYSSGHILSLKLIHKLSPWKPGSSYTLVLLCGRTFMLFTLLKINGAFLILELPLTSITLNRIIVACIYLEEFEITSTTAPYLALINSNRQSYRSLLPWPMGWDLTQIHY